MSRMPTALAFGLAAHSLPNLHKESSRAPCGAIGFQADSGRWEEGAERGRLPSDGPAWATCWPQPNRGQKCGAAVPPARLISVLIRNPSPALFAHSIQTGEDTAAAFRANRTAHSPAAVFNDSQALGLTSHLTFRQSLQNCSAGPSAHSEGR